MMRKRLERFDEVEIIDETHGFGLDFVKKTESGLTPHRSTLIHFLQYLYVFLRMF